MIGLIKRIPVPTAGLMLGLAAGGNLIQQWSTELRLVMGFLAAIIFVLLTLKLMLFKDSVLEELKNPVVASVAPTYSMGMMLLSVYIKPIVPTAALIMWTVAIVLHIGLAIFFSNKYIKYKTKHDALAFGITALEGIGIHSFIDGIIYSVTFSVSIYTGLLAGIGLMVHEFAEGVITFSMLVRAGLTDRRAVFYAFLVAGLTTPVGAFAAYPFIRMLEADTLGLALGFVVGVLVYISASHLLPEATENEKEHSYLAFLLGIALAVFLMLSQG